MARTSEWDDKHGLTDAHPAWNWRATACARSGSTPNGHEQNVPRMRPVHKAQLDHGLQHPTGEQRDADDDIYHHAKGRVPRAHVRRAVVVVVQPVPGTVREVVGAQERR